MWQVWTNSEQFLRTNVVEAGDEGICFGCRSTSLSASSVKKKENGKPIQGMFCFYSVSVCFLFNVKASDSFISSDLVDRLGLRPEIVD